MNPRWLHRALLMFTVVALAACGGLPVAMAQDTSVVAPVEPTAVQIELHDDGFQAAVDGEHRVAAEFFMASLALGELNVTWLNLGRQLAHLGRCQDAAKAYDRALFSPAVESPSRTEVASAIDRFRTELERDCVERVSNEHDPAWDGLLAEAHDDSPSTDDRATLLWSGVGAASLGGVLLVSAIVVDAGMLGERVDEVDEALRRGDDARIDELEGEIESLQTSATALYVSAGVSLATAAGLLTWYWLDTPSSETPTMAEGGRVDLWTPAAVTSSAGLRWTARF